MGVSLSEHIKLAVLSRVMMGAHRLSLVFLKGEKAAFSRVSPD